MGEENISQGFRMKNIDEARTQLIKEINKNDLISKKHKNVCKALNFMEQLLILFSAVTGFASFSAFSSLVGISIGNTNSPVGL